MNKPVVEVLVTTVLGETDTSSHALPLYILVIDEVVFQYQSPALSASPSLSVAGSDDLAPKYTSSIPSAEAAAAAALTAAAEAEVEAADACVVAVVAELAAEVAEVAAAVAEVEAAEA